GAGCPPTQRKAKCGGTSENIRWPCDFVHRSREVSPGTLVSVVSSQEIEGLATLRAGCLSDVAQKKRSCVGNVLSKARKVVIPAGTTNQDDGVSDKSAIYAQEPDDQIAT